ncbi:MAG: hypothetical protein QXR73_01655 [Candidatus Micrarchaeaceae archaeon]
MDETEGIETQQTNTDQQGPTLQQAGVSSGISQPQPSIPQETGHAGRAKLILSAIIIIILLASVVYYFEYFITTSSYTATTTITSNVTTTTSNATTTTTIITPKAPPNIYEVALRPYALYGIPNASQYDEFYTFYQNGSSLLNNSYAKGSPALQDFGYGINFTRTVVMSYTLPLNYDQPIPPQYSDYAYPVASIVLVRNFTNSTDAAAYLRFGVYYSHNLNNTPIAPISTVNHTEREYITIKPPASGILILLNNISSYHNASAFYNVTVTYNFTSINGTNVAILKISPFFTTLNQYTIAFQNHNHLVYIIGYGIRNHLNMSYPISIAKHILQYLQS